MEFSISRGLGVCMGKFLNIFTIFLKCVLNHFKHFLFLYFYVVFSCDLWKITSVWIFLMPSLSFLNQKYMLDQLVQSKTIYTQENLQLKDDLSNSEGLHGHISL